MKYNDCFALRFNLYKCGYLFPENTNIFAAMYDQSAEYLTKCLKDYESVNSQSAAELLADSDVLSAVKNLKGKNILFMGDSITSDRMSYAKILKNVLECNVTDGAVSSSMTVDLIVSLEHKLAEVKPDIVSVMIGTNDSVFSDKDMINSFTSIKEYERNLRIIADKIKGRGCEMILNAVHEPNYDKFNKINRFLSVSKENNDAFNAAIKRVAEEYNSLYNDFREEMKLHDAALLFEPDAIHLSPYAHKIIARIWCKSIVAL